MARVMVTDTVVAEAMTIRVAEAESIAVDAEIETVGTRGMGDYQHGSCAKYACAVFQVFVHNVLRDVGFFDLQRQDTGPLLNRG